MSQTSEAAGAQRAVHIDVIRGIAVFGLIWSNLNAGAYTGPTTVLDTGARWAGAIFSAGKFFTLFSLLFGVTLAIQLDRSASAGRPFVARWLWRMMVLFAIGWLHAILFWPGDILREYAVAGVVLVLFRRASTRTTLIAILASLGLAGTQQSLSVIATRVSNGDVAAVVQRETADAAQVARRRALGMASLAGTYRELLGARADQQVGEWKRRASLPAGPLNWINTWYLGVFLVGLLLGRKGIVQHPERHPTVVRRLMVWGLGVGIPLNVYMAARWPGLQSAQVTWTLGIIARLVLSLGYLGGILWLLQRREWLQRLRGLAPTGRLGLTNYVMQTAYLTFLKFNYGLGLEPFLGWFECFVLAFAFYALQVAISAWWLRHFRLGPLEWLWRSATSLRLAPLRVSTGAAAPVGA